MNHYRQVATLAAQTQQQQHTTGVPNRRSSAGLNASQDQSNQHPSLQTQHPLAIDVVESLAKAAVVAAAAASAGQQVPDSGNKSRSPDSHLLHSSQHLMPNQMRPGSQSAHNQSQHQQQQSSGGTGAFVRTRIRTSFDPELELPKLHKWFSENQHPSRAQIHHYVNELNSLESRRGRKPLDSNNVVYWFKNARAAHKRQELKLVNGWTENSNTSTSSPHKSTGGTGTGSSRHGHNRLTPSHHPQSLADSKSDRMSGSVSGNTGENGEDEEDDEDEDSMMHDESDERLAPSDEDQDEESDSSSAFRTLDLSIRPVKRRRTSHSGGETITADHHPDSRIKDEACSDPDDEEEDEEEDYYYSSPTHQQHPGSGIHGYFATNGASAALQHNGHNNSQVFPSSGTLGPNSSLNGGNIHSNHPDSPDNGSDGRRVRRSRTFIDPMTEVPRLEQWFTVNTHPTHSQIVRYTEELNRLQYRQKFPKLEPKNIQFWFKNRRAKYKRLSLPPNPSLNPFSNNNNSTCHPNNNTSANNGPTNGCSTLSPNSSAGLLLAASSLISSTSSSSPSNGPPAIVTTASSSPPPPPATGSSNNNKHAAQSITTPILTSALNIERLISN